MGKRQKIVSFDFDDTLCLKEGVPNADMLELVKNHAANGCKCYIITERNKSHESLKWIKKNQPERIRVKDFIKEHNLPIKQCHFTNHEPKYSVLYLYRDNHLLHYDNDDFVLEELRRNGIKCQKV